MRRKDAARPRYWYWLTWTAVLALGSVSQAGVFRIKTRNRQPVVPVVNNEHYGYYPTCWQPWPAGWHPCSGAGHPLNRTPAPPTAPHGAPPPGGSGTTIPFMPRALPTTAPHP